MAIKQNRAFNQKRVDDFNAFVIPESLLIYFPLAHSMERAKLTQQRSVAFLDSGGYPVVFVKGVSGYVHLEHIWAVDRVFIGRACPTPKDWQ